MNTKIIIVISLLFIIQNFKSQTDRSNCFFLRVLNKKYQNDSTRLQPQQYLQGFCVLTNGVYDFVINDKKFLYHKVVKISADTVYACYVFDNKPTLKFTPKDEIAIYLSQRRDGKIGLSRYTKIKQNDYNFKIIPSNNMCFLQTATVCSNKNCDIKYEAYQYLTAWKDFSPIYQENGYDCIIEGSVIEKIKKSDQK